MHYVGIYQFNICIPSARISRSSNSNDISSNTFRLSKLYVQVANYILFFHIAAFVKSWLWYWPGCVLLQAFVWSIHKTESILTQLTGFNPPLFISKYQAVKHDMHLQAHRPNKHDQCSNRVSEYHSYFKTNILEAHMILSCLPEQLKLLHERRKLFYRNHCHVTTIQLLALGHVDRKMRT